MKQYLLYILFFCCSVNIYAQTDSLVMRLYSGFGEHTIKKGYRIIYKLNYLDGYQRALVTGFSADSMFLNNKPAVSLRHISEIGYYSKQDKMIKGVGLGMLLLSGFLAYSYAVEQYTPGVPFLSQAGGLGWSLFPLVTGTAMLSLKRKTYKIPNPWQIQISQEFKATGFDFR